MRRMPSAPPNSPASNTTLSRGDAWPDWDASVVVQSSWANTNAAKSTSWESSTSRSRVDLPGLNVVVHGSTSATSASPFSIARSSLAYWPDEPRKMRGLFMRDSRRVTWRKRYALGHSRAPESCVLEPRTDPDGAAARTCEPRQAVSFWQRMNRASKRDLPEFLSDHPSDAHRIQRIRSWLPEADNQYVAPSS